MKEISKISIIVFSMDHPLQLHAFLQSVVEYTDISIEQVNIIYKTVATISYDKVRKAFSQARWIRQNDFKKNLSDCIQGLSQYVILCKDEDLFIGGCRTTYIDRIFENREIFGISFLANNECILNKELVYADEFFVWKWEKNREKEYVYHWNIECMLYRINDLEHIIKKPGYSEVSNPYKLEKLIKKSILEKKEKNMLAAFMQRRSIITTRADNDIYDKGIKSAEPYILSELYNVKNKRIDIEKIKKIASKSSSVISFDIVLCNTDQNGSLIEYESNELKMNFAADKDEYRRLQRKNGSKRFIIDDQYDYPCLYDKYDNAGSIDSHYFLQDIYMAKAVSRNNPRVHYDIGSRVEGFISHLLALSREVIMLDIRPLSQKIDGLGFVQCDATELTGIEDNSIDSLSSLHAIEHFGLGRYGDTIDPDAWEKVLLSIQRVIRPGGFVYISVPVGTQDRIYFNAHRMFEIHSIPSKLREMKLIQFAYIRNYEIVEISMNEFSETSLKEDYLCGMYIFKKC